MAKDKTNHLTIDSVLYLLLIAVSMAPGYLLVPYGMYFGDEPYQIMNTMDVFRSPMAPLTSWLGGILGSLTDFRWIAYRYLTVTLNYLAIIVGGLYLYRRVRSVRIAAITVSAAILFTGLSRAYHSIFGWDCCTAFFTLLLIICMLELVSRPNFKCLLVTGLAAAMTVSARIPNVAVIIPAGWLILLAASMRRCSGQRVMPKYYPWLYVLFSGIFFVAILCGLYGSVGAYVESLRSNMLSEHSTYSLLMVMLFDIVRYAFAILAFAMLARMLDAVRSGAYGMNYPKLRKAIILCASIAAVGFLSLMMFFNPKIVSVRWYDVDWVWLALGFATWRYTQKGDSYGFISSSTVLLLGCACFVGSNNGFIKYPGFIVLPLSTMLLLPLCSVKKMKYYMLIVGLPLLVIDIFTIREASFMDVGLVKADTRVDSGRAKGLYSTADAVRDVEAIEKFRKEADPEMTKIVIGEGFGRFAYEYLLDCPDSYLRHDWSNARVLDSPEYVEWLERRLTREKNPVIVYLHRGDNVDTAMKDYLDSNMRATGEYDGFTVYTR